MPNLLIVSLLALQSQVADTSPFRALALPTPTLVRGSGGAPGPRYWQQRADYVIRATLDTGANVLTGSERIRPFVGALTLESALLSAISGAQYVAFGLQALVSGKLLPGGAR